MSPKLLFCAWPTAPTKCGKHGDAKEHSTMKQELRLEIKIKMMQDEIVSISRWGIWIILSAK